jgi:hypothetical protein
MVVDDEKLFDGEMLLYDVILNIKNSKCYLRMSTALWYSAVSEATLNTCMPTSPHGPQIPPARVWDIDGYGWILWNGEARGFHRFPEFPGSGSYLSSLVKASLSLANRLHLGRFPTCEGQNCWQLVIFTGFQKWSYPKMEGLIMV